MPEAYRVIAICILVLIGVDVRADATAEYLYKLHCAGCHLADGRGAPPEVPDIRDSLGRIASDPQGRNYLARVPGASQAPVTDAELAAILNWVLITFNVSTLPADFKPLQADEVAQARKNVLLDPVAYRKALWPDE